MAANREMSESQTQLEAAESSPLVASLLTLAGGFLDAFTYVGHGKVFANSMTGNIVFLGVFSAAGQWQQSLRHVPPILAFLTGIFVAHCLRLPGISQRLPRPALACLCLEIVVLAIVSLLPSTFPDVLLVLGISLVAAMQSTSFSRLESSAYTSVMTTGNLRRCAEAFFSATMLSGGASAWRQARLFGVIVLCFLIGAGVGAFATVRLHNVVLWIPIFLLSAALFACVQPGRRTGRGV